MSTPLEDYALLSDLRTAALVSRDGSVDWLCLPRFDSPAMFSALLGGPEDGRWRLGVVDGDVIERRYLPDTFVLETTWRSPSGTARVTDCLLRENSQGDLVRCVECLDGEVEIEHDLRLRFDYARATPWTRQITRDGGERALLALAGPDGILITGPVLTWPGEGRGEHDGDGNGSVKVDKNDEDDDDNAHSPGGPASGPGAAAGGRADRLTGRFTVRSGERLDWDLTWFPSHEEVPDPPNADESIADTLRAWTDWASRLEVDSDRQPLVRRSLLVLRALTNLDTGAIVAAPTTSLPELFGGERNWDYRYTWLRDAAFTIEVVVAHGLTEGAALWRDWLLRAVAGDVDDVRIMYGLGGERDLVEIELGHLDGYEGSRPVRVGNGAADQYQADVVGEVMIALYELRDAGVEEDQYSWGLQKELLDFAEKNIDRPDHGIWEMRGSRHHFTHGRVMMWAAFDRGIRAVEEHGLDGPVDRWRELRDRLAEEIEEHGFNEELGSYTQTYDNTEVDASLLQLPHTGYLAVDDPRMLGTIARIEQDLVTADGFVHRYRTDSAMDGLEGGEYPFVLCTFWLVEQYAGSGRIADAEALMDAMVSRASDLGLLSEEYDPDSGRLAGNFPQAFSHIGLIRASDALEAARNRAAGPGRERDATEEGDRQ